MKGTRKKMTKKSALLIGLFFGCLLFLIAVFAIPRSEGYSPDLSNLMPRFFSNLISGVLMSFMIRWGNNKM